jgi:hypothetical protein
MISLDDSPGCGPRGTGPPVPNSDASHCGTNALQKSSTSQKTSTNPSNPTATGQERRRLTTNSLSDTIAKSRENSISGLL